MVSVWTDKSQIGYVIYKSLGKRHQRSTEIWTVMVLCIFRFLVLHVISLPFIIEDGILVAQLS